MGPAIGEVMRDLYLGQAPVVDVSPLTADRFTGPDLRPSSTSSSPTTTMPDYTTRGRP